jgi:hypothetical protein
MMKRLLLLAIALCGTGLGIVDAALAQESPYVLRDTTSFPPPGAGMARVLVARERFMEQGLKPEFVYVDRTPIGLLPQKSAVTAEVPAGWHRVWLGRGAGAEVWIEMEAGGRYLVRLRENLNEGTWRADLVRDAGDGYADFAKEKGLKLAITSESGMGALTRNLEKKKPDANADSLARASAIAGAALPIRLAEAWYQDLLAPARVPMEYELHPGRLELDATTLRFVRGDTTAVEIPRESIEAVRYGGHRDNGPNPWIKIGYRIGGEEKAARFADTHRETATSSYNRLFAELQKSLSGR